MTEHPNVITMRGAYAELAAGNLPGLLGYFAPDAIFHVGGNGPLTGQHKGREAIAEALTQGVLSTGGTQRFEVRGIFADDRHAVVVTRETATRATDGRQLDVEEVHLFSLNPDGSVAEIWDIPADHEAHDAFFDGR